MAYEQRFVRILDSLVRAHGGASANAEAEPIVEALREVAAQGELTIVLLPNGPLANGSPLPPEISAPGGLLGALRCHGVKRFFSAQEAPTDELLAVARALALPADAEGNPFTLRLRMVQVWNVLIPRSTPISVSFVDRGAIDRDRAAPSLVPPLVPDERPAERPSLPDTEQTSMLREITGDIPLPDVPEVETMVGLASTQVLFDAMIGSLPAAPRAGVSAERLDPTPAPLDSLFVNSPVLLRPTSSALERRLGVEDLLQRLSRVQKLAEVERLLEELLTRAEWAARSEEPVLLARILVAVLRRAELVQNNQVKLKFQMMRGRFLIRPHLEEVGRLLPRFPEARADLLEVLGAAGELGAEVVVDLLVEAESASDRRSYFSSLSELKSGEIALLHMLGDSRWYAARNAAQLLGELRVLSAEGPLLDLLRHRDARVRRASVSALGKLGTLRAFQAVREALGDPDASMRIHAAVTLVGCGWTYALTDLKRALDGEEDPEVQRMLVAAIGRLGTGEAVAVLDEMASPGGFFRRRSRTPLRLAAVHALGESGNDRALRVLTRLAQDRENEIRQTAARALGQRAGFRATPADLQVLDGLISEKEALSEP